ARQRNQHQVQRELPARGAHVALVAALDHGDVELVRQDEHRQRAEQHQRQEAPGPTGRQFLHRPRRQSLSPHRHANATASTRRGLCRVALARRVPNSTANTAIASATYIALSCHAGTVARSVSRVVSIAKLIATALSCSVMYGISPSAATRVMVAASHASLPSRVAIRSASEVALVSRARRTSFIMKPTASAYSTIAPRNVGGSGQP